MDFFKDTLAGIQEHSEDKMLQSVRLALNFLVSHKLVTVQKIDNGTMHEINDLGRLVAMKYLNPKTAVEFLHIINSDSAGKKHTLGLIQTITSCHGFDHNVDLREKDMDIADALLDRCTGEMFKHDSDGINRATLALYKWINEETPGRIESTIDVWEGTLHAYIKDAEWLLYCFSDLARHKHNNALKNEAVELKIRVKHGILSELLDLVKLKNVGRTRARNLYDRGHTDRKSLRDVPARKIAEVEQIGDKLAESIVKQLNGKQGN